MKPRVFYDGSCPLCSREIGFYRRRDGAERIDWQDVSKAGSTHVIDGLTRDAALARFHVLRADGTLVSGGDAFRTLWLALPLMRPLGWLFSLPVLRGLLNVAYDGFLKWRNRPSRCAS